MIIPFLGVLFGNQDLVLTMVPWEFNFESFFHNFNYYLSKIIIDNGQHSALMFVAIFVFILVLLKTGFFYIANYIMAPLRNGVVRDIRNHIYNKILRLQLAFFSDEKKGDIMAKMTGDVQEVEISVIRSIEIIFKEPVTIIVYVISLIAFSPQLTLIVLLILPLAGLLIGFIGKSLRKRSMQAQTKMGVLLSLIEETLSGLRIIKGFSAEDKVSEKFTRENNNYTRIMVKMWRRRDLAVPISEFLGTSAVVFLMWYGGSLILKKEMDLSPQEFIGFLAIFSQIINPAKAFTNAYYNIQKGMASADRIDDLLYAQSTIFDKENALPLNGFNDSIEYKNVSFQYKVDAVLKNINLNIEKGKTIAFVGQSGSGKSTLVDLLPRFYDPVSGQINIDGVNIKDLKLHDLRSIMGIVNQDPILFNDTIFNNIAFGSNNHTLEEVISAAKVANAHDFIVDTPDGYETNIGDRGGKLSGGQRQRISIARAVLANPPVLILDEATSALDTESERLVQDALTRLMKNRTSLVIAHRLSTIINADEICVINEGEIAERGSHAELIALNGIYKKLYDLQSFS